MITKFKSKIRQLYLNVGAYFLRKGTGLVVGQKLNLPKPVDRGFKGGRVKRGATTVWIENIYFDFKKNKITYSFSDRPVMIPTVSQNSNEKKG